MLAHRLYGRQAGFIQLPINWATLKAKVVPLPMTVRGGGEGVQPHVASATLGAFA